MRGPDIQQDTLFSTASPESRVPKYHPLRPIRTMIACRFFAQVLGQAEQAELRSKEHFSVNGTMIEALASL